MSSSETYHATSDSGFRQLSHEERRHLAQLIRKARVAHNVHKDFEGGRTFGERLSDTVASFGGSWTFIIIFAVALLSWCLLNTVALAGNAFDPYPFIFLNLLLSTIAAIQAPVIMMSQNRQAARDRVVLQHDYEVNLKAEMEIVALHDKLDRLRVNELAERLEAMETALRAR